MKDLGFNLVRKHIKVESRRWYYHADRLGLMVWQDMPARYCNGENGKSIWYCENIAPDPLFDQQLYEMVVSRRQHPCIIGWVPYNEGIGFGEDINIHYTRSTVAWLQTMDATRLVDATSGINDSPFLFSEKGDGTRTYCMENRHTIECDSSVGDMVDGHYMGTIPFGQQYSLGVRPSVSGEEYMGPMDVQGLLEHCWSPVTNRYGYGCDGRCERNSTPGGPSTSATVEQATERYVQYITQGLIRQKEQFGLSAQVLTQWTDVECEINGVWSYDRKFLKVNATAVKAANMALLKVDSEPVPVITSA
jgi:hypothetical protein